MKFSISQLARPEDVDAIRAEWEALEASTALQAPFSSPTWNWLWWKHFKRNGLLVNDQFLVLVVRYPDNKLAAVAPMFLRSFPALGPFRARLLQFFGADSSITELRGIVCAAQDAGAVSAAVRAYLQDRWKEWDLLCWSGATHALAGDRQVPRNVALQELPNYYITLPTTWAELETRLTAKFRRNMRRRLQLFTVDGFSYCFRCIKEPVDIGPALERFFLLHGLRAAASGMAVKHPDRFAEPKARTFLREYVHEMAARNQCRLFELVVSEQTVASQLAFSMGDHLWLYSTGFDTKWQKYGIMTMLTAEILKWAIKDKFAVVNLSCGQDLGKLRWNPSEAKFLQFFEPAPTIRGRMCMAGYRSLTAARHTVAWLRGYRSGEVTG